MSRPLRLFRYAGGKAALAQVIQSYFPASFGTYIETCVGSASVYLAVRPSIAILADANPLIVRTFKGVRDQPDNVIAVLSEFKNTSGCYYLTRNSSQYPLFNSIFEDYEMAAWLIYLMATGYNGLYRVNRSGVYNTPFGKRKNVNICNVKHIMACSAALQGATLVCGDFQSTMQSAREGDLVYVDPPYIKGFTGYTAGGFDMNDQRRLRDIASQLAKRDVRVLISNSDTADTRSLYSGPEFHINTIIATRSIAARTSSRGKVGELVISNYHPRLYRRNTIADWSNPPNIDRDSAPEEFVSVHQLAQG